jgi:hypothetical protein
MRSPSRGPSLSPCSGAAERRRGRAPTRPTTLPLPDNAYSVPASESGAGGCQKAMHRLQLMPQCQVHARVMRQDSRSGQRAGATLILAVVAVALGEALHVRRVRSFTLAQ